MLFAKFEGRGVKASVATVLKSFADNLPKTTEISGLSDPFSPLHLWQNAKSCFLVLF